MANVIKGFPPVDLSITNPNVKLEDALDKFAPYSYLKFIQTVSESYQPDTLVAFYNDYVNKWNIKSNKKATNEKDEIIARYQNFLQDITLNFTTNAERTFLTQINFENPHDLEIAMSFYSKKIRDIISYYKKKRDTLHYASTKAKVKGSSLGVEQATINLILDFLENRSTAARDYDVTKIKENLTISITEYFDNFSQYFNRLPDSHDYGRTFKSYDPAGLPKDNIFLTDDEDLVQQVFANVGEDLIALKEGRQQLWVVYEQDEAIKGVATTEILSYPNKTMLGIQYLGGRDLETWGFSFLEMAEDFAKAVKCSGIEATARKGFWKWFKEYYYKDAYTVFEKEIEP